MVEKPRLLATRARMASPTIAAPSSMNRRETSPGIGTSGRDGARVLRALAQDLHSRDPIAIHGFHNVGSPVINHRFAGRGNITELVQQEPRQGLESCVTGKLNFVL